MLPQCKVDATTESETIKAWCVSHPDEEKVLSSFTIVKKNGRIVARSWSIVGKAEHAKVFRNWSDAELVSVELDLQRLGFKPIQIDVDKSKKLTSYKGGNTHAPVLNVFGHCDSRPVLGSNSWIR